MTIRQLKGVCVGAGYFSQFHYEAWSRIPQVAMTACCDTDRQKLNDTADRFAIAGRYADVGEMLDAEQPDFIDIITPPPTHADICREAASRGVAMICQKPLAPTLEEARRLVAHAEATGSRLMIHENFRFQPWHRKIRQLLQDRAIGDQLFSLTMRSRQGDGWGPDAYLARQPYFRDYPRLLVYETGIHFIDTFRFLAGEISRVSAWLRRLNPAISGEDCGLLIFEFSSGAIGQWDANRFNEPATGVDPRYTFGDLLVEGSGGSLRLSPDGTLMLQRLGQPATDVNYTHAPLAFASDCVRTTQQHFVDCLLDGSPFETDGRDYLKNLVVQEAVYQSAETREPVKVNYS